MATIPTSECLTDGCTAPRHARGWCANHYAYFRSRGEVAAFDEWTPRGGTCEVDGCGRKHYARGWCRAHYQQWYHGEEVRPLTRARDRTLRQRIEQRIIIAESGCWEWQGAVGPTGYGHLHWDGQLHPVHRLSHIEYVGPIPAGYDVHHECYNRRCCNPDHLTAMTHADNVRNRRVRNRTCP